MSSFIKKTLTLSGGTFMSQLIALLGVLLITRLYTPAAFGEYSVVLSYIFILSVLSTLRLEALLPLSSEPSEAKRLFVFVQKFGVFFCSVIMIFVLVTELNIFPSSLVLASFFFATSVYATGIIKAGQFYLLYLDKYKSVGYIKVLLVCLTLFLQYILCFVLSAQYISLLIGFSVANLFAMYFILRIIKKNCTEKAAGATNELYQPAYFKFSKVEVPVALFNIMAIELPIIIILAVFEPALAGIFALLQRVMASPVTLISQSLSQVFLTEGAKLDDSGVFHLAKKIVLLVVSVSLPVVLIISNFGEEVFRFLLGESWGRAGVLSEILVWNYFGQFIFVPISFIFIMKKKQSINLVLQFILLIARCSILLLLPAYEFSELGVISIYSYVSLLAYTIAIYVALSVSNKKGGI